MGLTSEDRRWIREEITASEERVHKWINDGTLRVLVRKVVDLENEVVDLENEVRDMKDEADGDRDLLGI